MTDFLVTMVTLYPWFTWLIGIFFAVTVAFWLLMGIVGVKSVLDWREIKREDRRILADILARAHAGDDPPEYEPDEDQDGLIWCDVCKAERPQDCICGEDADERWPETLAAIAGALGKMNDDDQLPDGPPAEPPEPRRCEDQECEFYGWAYPPHPPGCRIVATMPVPKVGGLSGPGKPAGPPIPVSIRVMPLHPAIQADLEAAGFGGHEYVSDVAESAYTKAQAAEVQAMMRELER